MTCGKPTSHKSWGVLGVPPLWPVEVASCSEIPRKSDGSSPKNRPTYRNHRKISNPMGEWKRDREILHWIGPEDPIPIQAPNLNPNIIYGPAQPRPRKKAILLSSYHIISILKLYPYFSWFLLHSAHMFFPLNFKRSRAGFFEYSMANPYGYDLGAIYNAMSGASVTPSGYCA